MRTPREELAERVANLNQVETVSMLLICAHLQTYYPDALEATGEDGKTKIGFAVTVKNAASRPHVKVRVSFSRSTSDEAELWVEDEAQPELFAEEPLEAATPRARALLELTAPLEAELIEDGEEESNGRF